MIVMITIAIVIRLVNGATTLLLAIVCVIRRSLSIGSSGIDTQQQEEKQKLK